MGETRQRAEERKDFRHKEGYQGGFGINRLFRLIGFEGEKARSALQQRFAIAGVFDDIAGKSPGAIALISSVDRMQESDRTPYR